MARYVLTTINKDRLSRLQEIDWSFPNLSNKGLHSFHWYPATYLAAIPGTIIPYLSEANETVLDPFSGSGTTGLEAIRLNRRYIGFDTNPVAILMAKAKLSFPSPNLVREYLLKTLERSQVLLGGRAVGPHPRHDELSGWYHPNTLETLNAILNAILIAESPLLKTVMLSAFSSILKGCSSQGKHWGWVCDNVKPKAEEIIFKDAVAAFTVAMTEYEQFSDQAYLACQVHAADERRENIRQRVKLLHGDCIDRLRKLPTDSIDLILTSPPYYGVADYVKSQRLTFLWFDKDELSKYKLGFRDFENLRSIEAGARSNRHRTNSHSSYMAFMETFFEECSRVLRRDRAMGFVIGESPSRPGTIDELIALAQCSGFSLESRLGRDIRHTRRRLMAKVKGEDILVFVNRGSRLCKNK